MYWPSLAEYQSAVQYPKTSFTDPVLASGVPELDRLGFPKPTACNYAIIFAILNGNSIYNVLNICAQYCKNRVWYLPFYKLGCQSQAKVFY